MKRLTWIGVVILIIGIVFSVFGLSRVGFNWNNVGTTFKTAAEGSYGKQYTKSLAHFDRIEVNSAVHVTVKHGTDYQVIGRDANGQHTKYHVENGQLTIGDNNEQQHSNVQFIGLGSPNYTAKITILVPDNVSINHYQQNNFASALAMYDIKINDALNLTNVSDINLQNVVAAALNFNASDGGITIKNSRFTRAASNIDSADGDMVINDSQFKALNVNSNDGDISMYRNMIKQGTSRIQSSDGDVELGPNQWNSLHVSSDDGDVSFAHQTIKQNLTADSGDGDVTGTVKQTDNANISVNTDDGDKQIARSLNHPNSHKLYRFYTSDGDISIRNGD